MKRKVLPIIHHIYGIVYGHVTASTEIAASRIENTKSKRGTSLEPGYAGGAEKILEMLNRKGQK